MAMRFKQLSGEEINIDSSLIFLGLAKTSKRFRKLANRLAATTVHWICKTYYNRGPLLTSRRIGIELYEMFVYEDRLFLKKTNTPSLPPSSWSIDAEVDAQALIEMISHLSEEDLTRGDANMSIFLRNAMGRPCPPSLIREKATSAPFLPL